MTSPSHEKVCKKGFTYDDLLLIPAFSKILPSEVDTKSQFTKGIRLNVPLVSAAMDTVTEAKAAICMAQEGGIGIIHKNLTPIQQADRVRIVKRSKNWIITDPITINFRDTVSSALKIMGEHNISGLPVVVGENKLTGIVTHRDLRFESDLSKGVKDVMTKGDKLVTVTKDITPDEAKKLLHKHKIEKLLMVDSGGNLMGLITTKDIEKRKKYPLASLDKKSRLIVGAAVGVGSDMEERIAALVKAKVDVIVVDTAHGHSQNVIEAVELIKMNYPELQVVAGNVATPEAVKDLCKAGVDAVKVGIGGGSICTTRVVSGVGMPQMTAIFDCVEEANKYNIPVIADGGIKFSGDITKALAGGASSVMIGSMIAGTEETPGDVILFQGKRYKQYRGMGSLGAMKEGSKDRYSQEDQDDKKLVPEGIEGRVPYRGHMGEVLFQLLGGLKSGMGYTGCQTIADLHKNAQFVEISLAGHKEGHVHDVYVTEESPNYKSF